MSFKGELLVWLIHWRAGRLARRNGSDGEMGGARSLDWPRDRIGGCFDRRRDFPPVRHLAGARLGHHLPSRFDGRLHRLIDLFIARVDGQDYCSSGSLGLASLAGPLHRGLPFWLLLLGVLRNLQAGGIRAIGKVRRRRRRAQRRVPAARLLFKVVRECPLWGNKPP